MASSSFFSLRWESTGDHQWWYASPVDLAAASGHYDLVRELLRIDPNLLIKLTSLRRLRRLDSLWPDPAVRRRRASVARALLRDCGAPLLRAGYGGWLLYTAASAGDPAFVADLLAADPLLVFGSGEYGVTDIFYAAAAGRSAEAFAALFDHAVRPRGGTADGVLRAEMVRRALHAAARGGDLEMMRKLLDGGDVLLQEYRDAQGSTLLHAASGRGQLEVVRNLVSSYNMINSKDNQGNTALHIAAYFGHLPVVEALLAASPSSSTERNDAGNTFLHMAVAGFRTPGFRSLDRQMDLMKQLVSGTVVNIRELINLRNNEGRTALHVAVIGNVHSDLVELLMTVASIDLNVQDVEGMTALDLLNQRPRSASSEILIKKMSSAGGVANAKDHATVSAVTDQVRLLGIGSSPGTSFKMSDAEVFLYTGVETSEASGRHSTSSGSCKSEIAHEYGEVTQEKKKKKKSAAGRLKVLLPWSARKKPEVGDDRCEREDTPTPLRQRFSKPTALVNNKRMLSVRSSAPSLATKKRFTSGLMHGVMQDMPHLAHPVWSPSEKLKGICPEEDIAGGASCSYSSVDGVEEEAGAAGKPSNKSGGFANTRFMNRYFCFGAQGLTVEDSASGRRSSRMFRRSSALSVA
ncbi:uncharacterized protein M6B38_380185 [Iris pallida]|uniref:Uncharacterized protein n=1 Tax=Iris pallida TaxID=29817 RepID=A0AAX6G8X4_IRIPA|nr:uncharacterized protein M6B38_380185 [Iris pallida]